MFISKYMDIFRKIFAALSMALILNFAFGGTVTQPVFAQEESDRETGVEGERFTVQICNPLSADCTGGDTGVDVIIERIIGYMIDIGIPIAVIMYVWAGFLFLTSAGDPAKIKKGKMAIIWTSVGLAVLILANGLVLVVKSILTP